MEVQLEGGLICILEDGVYKNVGYSDVVKMAEISQALSLKRIADKLERLETVLTSPKSRELINALHQNLLDAATA